MDLKFLIPLLLFTQAALAGFPPTTVKDSGDASAKTTFNFQFPNFTGSHAGVTYSLGVNGIAGGGTGQTTANAALNAFLPDQSGHPAEFLTTDGTNSFWGTVPGGTIPTAVSTTLATTTSASTTFVTAITVSITTTAASAPVLASCALDMTSATAASVANARITIDGVSGGTVSQSLTTATTQHLTIPPRNLSASLGPGAHTVNCDFARASGTGTVTVGQGSLNAIGLQGANSNGITQVAGLGLNAGPGSGLQTLTGILNMAGGGTNASLTAANGAIPYSTASAFALLAPGTLGQLVRSGGAGAPTWTSETFPASTTINQLLYSSANNVVGGITASTTSALVENSTGVPSWASGATANRLLRTNGTTVSFAQANLTTDVTATLPYANGGTGTTALASGRIPISNGTNLLTAPELLWDDTAKRVAFGNPGSARLTSTVSSGSDLGIGVQCDGTNNCVQVRNDNAYNLALLNANNSNALGGVLIGAERSRGLQTGRTQALNGDGELNFVGTCYTGAGSSAGASASMQYVLSEDCTSSTNGGEIVFNTTLNGTTATTETMRLTNDKVAKFSGHLKTIGTAPTVLVEPGAGTGATCTIANATDTAGEVTVTTGTLGVSTGSYCTITFAKPYAVAPICVLTPASSTLSSSVYVTKSTTTFDINFAIAGGISSTYVLNYNCIETQ